MKTLSVIFPDAKLAPENLDTVFFDLETMKVDSGGWMPWGRLEPSLSRRWKAFMCSMVWFDKKEKCWLGKVAWSEKEKDIVGLFSADKTYHYAATREFDEMVMRGKFTYARRAHAIASGPWPHVADSIRFVNVRRDLRDKPLGVVRGEDVASKECPLIWARRLSGEKNYTEFDMMVLHCLRDSVALAIRSGYGSKLMGCVMEELIPTKCCYV